MLTILSQGAGSDRRMPTVSGPKQCPQHAVDACERQHDPDHDDDFLTRLEKLCQERFKESILAREGMELEM